MSTVKRRVLVAAAEFGAVIRYLRENEATFDAKTGEIARFPWRIKGVSHQRRRGIQHRLFYDFA